MKIAFNFKKKHFYFLVLVFVVFGAIILTRALTTNNKPWHPLQEVSASSSGTNSVDLNNDGVIDFAENAQQALISEDTNGIKGVQVFWENVAGTERLCYTTSSSCSSVSATCSKTTNIVFLTGPGCDASDCNSECVTRAACIGNSGGCPGTIAYYIGGGCNPDSPAPPPGCSDGSDRCYCRCTANSVAYTQATFNPSTKKCSSFT